MNWEIALPGKLVALPVERDNGEIILICEDRRVYSINSYTGNINWKIKPGGKLSQLLFSLDGSIIIRDEKKIYSIFGSGKIRWSKEVQGGIEQNIELNDRGDIFYIEDNRLKMLNRFGFEYLIKDNFSCNNFVAISNYLIVYTYNNKLTAITYGGKEAWANDIIDENTFLGFTRTGIYLISSFGEVEKYNNNGELIGRWDTKNKNPYRYFVNAESNFLFVGDYGTTIINDSNFSTKKGNSISIYYSNGKLIEALDNWSILAKKIETENSDIMFFPSIEQQRVKKTITLSDKRVWGDENLSNYYKELITSGERDLQRDLLKTVEKHIKSTDLLEKIPNFYEVLLLMCSKENKYLDMRQEAYRLMGLSKDISFVPYLLNNLEMEKSYIIISYIYFALGQIGIDRTGNVIKSINSRLDSYYDENLVLNALYAMYNINLYTDSEYVDLVFMGIEKILNGGYSNYIMNKCYEIIKKLK